MSSLSDAARLRITSDTDKYEINGFKFGPLFFKYLMTKALVYTRANTSHTRENLDNIDTYITMVNSNITNFNEYFK